MRTVTNVPGLDDLAGSTGKVVYSLCMQKHDSTKPL